MLGSQGAQIRLALPQPYFIFRFRFRLSKPQALSTACGGNTKFVMFKIVTFCASTFFPHSTG